MKSRSLHQIFFLNLLFTFLIASVLSETSTCPKDFTDEVYYPNGKERYIVTFKEQASNDAIGTHYTYLRDCMNRILIYSSETNYHDKVNGTKISENLSVIYILSPVNMYFGFFSPLYDDGILSKMKIIQSAEKDQTVSISE